MPLNLSPFSQVCKGFRAHLDARINTPTHDKVGVVLGTPAETASTDAAGTPHRLNLFFYRFEPAGLFPDTLPGETGWLRAYCLITPFAGSEDSVSAGENDLRLIGEVVRIFHEEPTLTLHLDGEDYYIQVIFQPLGLDQLNQLWSTQGDTIYRPSVLYEVSLAPVVPSTPAVPAPLAGGLGLDVRVTREGGTAGVSSRLPEVPIMTPDIAHPGWTPAIAFVHEGVCAFSLSLRLGSEALNTFVPKIWLAGKVGERVRLRWQTWDAVNGWQGQPLIEADITSQRIDPESAADADLTTVTLPFTDHVGQMLLHAERDYVRPGDGVTISVRSNPLLVSIFAG